MKLFNIYDTVGFVLAAPFFVVAFALAAQLYNDTPIINQTVKLQGALDYGLSEMKAKTDPVYADMGIESPLAIRSLSDAQRYVENMISKIGGDASDEMVNNIINGGDQGSTDNKLVVDQMFSKVFNQNYVATSSYQVTKVY